jgi:predicted O-linked N-acetylglucosamine transferase (SPINDLY family)
MFPTSALASLLLSKEHISFFESRHHPYYVVSPNYAQKSSGPRVLHYLCHTLNELGYEAWITSETASPWLRTPRLTQEVRNRHEMTGRVPIMVYPEVAPGNLLKGKVIARWILNRAGHLGGETSFRPDELLFYWDEWVLSGEKGADRLYLDSVNSRIFNTQDTAPENRSGSCYYAHKYLMYGGQIHPWLLANSTNLCQDIHRSPEEIAHILKTSTLLYCYEPSNLISEAYACGCPAVIIRTPYSEQFDLTANGIPRIEESAIPDTLPRAVNPRFKERYRARMEKSWQTIENFIKRTQAAAECEAERQKTPAGRLEKALAAFQNQDFETAMNGLAPLLDVLPEDPLPPAYLAFICAAQGMVQEADEFIGRAREVAPGRADLLAALGESHLKAGNAEAALPCLQTAVAEQPDLLAAYPALGRSLHLCGRSDEAITLLTGAAVMPSTAQADIQSSLLEILVEQGDVDAFTQFCQRYSHGLADDLLVIRNLARIDTGGEALIDALVSAQTRLSTMLANTEFRPVTDIGTAPRRIAFLVSDLAREERQGRLLALLRHLPAEDFVTALLIDGPMPPDDEQAQICSLLADHCLDVSRQDDGALLAQLDTLAPDVLIDLGGYSPSSRLAVLARSGAPIKLLWGETPLPPLDPDWLLVHGDRLIGPDAPPGLVLPELGECLDLPEQSMTPGAREDGPIRFACLTPAIRIGQESWALFAGVMQAVPDSTLTLNLHDLGEPARQFISSQFTKAGVDAGRLRFIHAKTPEALCRHWDEADIGLAPPVDTGEIALPSCLWMGKPFVALASPLPWGQRPAALLAAAGAGEWLASTPEEYIALASRTPPGANPSFRETLCRLGLNDPAAFAAGFAAAITALIEGRQA